MDENRKSNLKARFAKWQLLTIEELGKTISLFLGITIAVVGFQVSMVTSSKEGYDFGCNKFSYILSLIVLLASIASGLMASINRLVDFRLTTMLINKKIAREFDSKIKDSKIKIRGEAKIEIEELKKRIRRLGRNTWSLFIFQLSLFSLGLIIFMSYIFNVYLVS